MLGRAETLDPAYDVERVLYAEHLFLRLFFGRLRPSGGRAADAVDDRQRIGQRIGQRIVR